MSLLGLARVRLTDILRRLVPPSTWRSRIPAHPVPPGDIFLVARHENAKHVVALLAPAAAAGWRCHVWCLDSAAGLDASWVRGRGAGLKFDLLGQMIDASPPGAEQVIVLADDDVVLNGGDIADLVRLGLAAGLQLFQPARSTSRHSSHPITYRRVLSVCRATTFVEIGPIVVIDPTARRELVPWRSDAGMGFGLDLEWGALVRGGLRLGIVDILTVDHLRPVGHGYGSTVLEAATTLEAVLSARGLSSVAAAQQTLATWRPWRRRPPWARSAT